MIKKFRRSRLGKKANKQARKVKDLVPAGVAEKAAEYNPLAPDPEPTVVTEVPQITSESIAKHREQVLSGARKYIYPLQHSKHRIIIVTVSIVAAAVIGLLTYCSIGLYRLYQYNTFIYRITQVVPFPIAKVGSHYVDYENYLFELRHYVHYYQSQLQLDFSGEGKQQLISFRQQALNDAINGAYIKILAAQNHVSVSGKEVNDRITEVREQNRLGDNNKVFDDVLRNYWGWSENDFKRALKDEILSEKVVAKLDTATTARAAAALAQLKAGGDFQALAKQVSDALDKASGGDYGFGITKSNPNVPPQVVEVLFQLKAGQTSGVIDAGQTLEIVQVVNTDGTTVTARHISFNLQDISVFIKPLKTKYPTHTYVHF
ncbi:MAG TPA: peptidylprolyl isomerase [Candidatus Nitrosopolaris sp.]|nr:peptidylprolyl isomerase [Candidatus Nitrosopolaris sp.]